MMNRKSCFILIVASWFFVVTPSHADTLWYNGDYDERVGLLNFINPSITYDCIVYDDFLVPEGQSWIVNSVWSNNRVNESALNEIQFAWWEIRSGVSEANGGTVVASGEKEVTVTATGNPYEYTVEIMGLDFILSNGLYWLSVTPKYADNNFTYITPTSGTNAIGTPAGNNDNSFVNSEYFSVNFTAAHTVYASYGYEYNPVDFSMGIGGTREQATPVPEPMTFLLLGIGFAGLIAWRRQSVLN
jgi:hypothetical protein